MTRPRINQFGSYFKALHGYEPFPWQRRLAATVIEDGRWPDFLDIPTGLGKTNAIDIALFVLAARPELSPRRIIMVVDRRVVVDQAADHAHFLQRRLAEAKDGPLMSVATGLRELWNGPIEAEPFTVAVLRGGMPRDEGWTHRPDQPAVVLSTVDQVGSRLLFRGYGVSASMAPVHAGLLGNDSLILLDEVQLSMAFAETLAVLDKRWRCWRERDHEHGVHACAVPDRWAFVRMSATPLDASEEDITFSLDNDDFAHPVVDRRRTAHKLATLDKPIDTSKTDLSKSARAVVEGFAAAALSHLDRGCRRVAVIVNRVTTAREIHDELLVRVGGRADVALLTGRMRPLDRQQVFGKKDDHSSIASRVAAGARRESDLPPVIVVATQTIEAGADFDFDALVTECASLDALRQRFGRLDRRGELGECRATILVRRDQSLDSNDDPVYGSALKNTWAWMEAKAGKSRTVDFGIAHFPRLPKRSDLAGLCSPIRKSPVMMPAHIDAWAQTNPRGEPDPDVSLWLHGPDRGLSEVRVVWRGDVDAEQLNDQNQEELLLANAIASLAVSPPSSLESISIPLSAFRAWLAQERAVDFADVEGVAKESSAANARREKTMTSRAALVVSKAGARVVRRPEDIAPDATVVVPSTYGGIRNGNWNPDALERVRDLGDWAQFVQRGRPVLRLVPDLLQPGPASKGPSGDSAPADPNIADDSPSPGETIPRVPTTDDPEFNPRDAIIAWLENNCAAVPEDWQLLAESLLEYKSKLRPVVLGTSRWFAAVGQRQIRRARMASPVEVDVISDVVNDDDDGASYTGEEIGLETHLKDVERWARTFAKHLSLPNPLADDLALACRMHDIGKADPRFQQVLHGGSSVKMAASKQLIAKSRGNARDRAAREAARKRSGYPESYRHELLSVAMLAGNPEVLAEANDPDLVLHLIGSHHGWCRPFAPAADHGPSLRVELEFHGSRFAADTAHGLATVDSGVGDRYWLLTERYGWWTLAWFETLVRLADHRASEERSELRDTGQRMHSRAARRARVGAV